MTATKTVFGLDMAEERYDILAFRHVRPEWREYETSLMTSKWWDYRFMNPVAATYLYAHYYREEFKAMYRKAINHKAAEFINPLKVNDLFMGKPALISGMWRGRQHADAMGIPYNLYIRFAMEARMAYWARAAMPQPQHLYSEMVTDIVQAKWLEHLEGFFMTGHHEAYKVANYAHLTTQDQHIEWLFTQAAKRQNVQSALVSLCEAGMIARGDIQNFYNAEVADRVLSMAA